MYKFVDIHCKCDQYIIIIIIMNNFRGCNNPKLIMVYPGIIVVLTGSDRNLSGCISSGQ